jgi:hypothetical protein
VDIFISIATPGPVVHDAYWPSGVGAMLPEFSVTVQPISPFWPRFKRGHLLLLLALTGWTAILVALALYRGGRTSDNLNWAMSTTLAQGFLMLVSFAAFTALDHARLRFLALAGMLAAALMLALLPVFAWWQITDAWHIQPINEIAHDPMCRLAATGVLSAGLMCLVPFILIPRMQRVGRIMQLTTILYLVFAYLAAVLYLWRIETQRIEEALTTLLIPAGACMLGVFTLHKFLEIRHPDPLTSVTPAVHIRCPRCQCAQALALGDSRCRRCRLRISIAVEEPRCPNCQFNLHQLTRPICPECGFHLDAEDVPAENAGDTAAPDGAGSIALDRL